MPIKPTNQDRASHPGSHIEKKLLIQQHAGLFQCPICKSAMYLQELKSLVCQNNHCFDLAKNGYINLLGAGVKNGYTKALFEARNALCSSGFFAPLTQRLAQLILAQFHAESAGDPCRILDAGCGEGSHLAHVLQHLYESSTVDCQGVGIDIAKEAIQIAAREYKKPIWCVGDLTKNPFKDGAFHVILNILSPSNYAEFSRMLSGDGVLLKVVPGSRYLQELRSFFYDRTDRQTYSNEKVVAHFQQHFDCTNALPLTYTVTLTPPMLQQLIRMTPLTWNATQEQVDKAMQCEIQQVTVDLLILVGKKSAASA